MPKQTLNYRLGYFSTGERTDPQTESHRWTTLDAQLTGLYQVLGNGVLSGWGITPASGQPLKVSIAAGSGVVAFVSVSSVRSVVLGPLVKNTTNHIYALIGSSSYWTQAVNFQAFVQKTTRSDAVYLGKVTTNATGIVTIDTTGVQDIGIINSIQELIKAHRHIGGPSSPTQIDLGSEVEGTLGQGNPGGPHHRPFQPGHNNTPPA